MNRLVLLAGLLFVFLVGCSRESNTPQPTLIPTQPILPSATPQPVITLTPTIPAVTIQITTELANCRTGPGTMYQTVGEIAQGKIVSAVGRNDSSTWWYVKDPGNPGNFCWVASEVADEQGAADQLPVTLPSVSSVVDVNLRVEPNRISVNCSQFPQTVFFEAEITTNGPALFTWKWEASTGAVSDVGTLVFEEAGTQVVNEYYQINAPNEYWVKFYVLSPNEMVEQVNFPVSCTP